MKTIITGLLGLCVLLGFPGQTDAAPATENPLYRVSVVQTPAKAINYRDLRGSVQIDFKGTVLLPYANGSAKIANAAGAIKIKARFENLTSASQFGPEYLTYVFWAISPDGRATNLGELITNNGNAAREIAVASTVPEFVSHVTSATLVPGDQKNLNVTFNELKVNQNLLYGTLLIGKMVNLTFGEEMISGVVDKVKLTNDLLNLVVNGQEYSVKDVVSVEGEQVEDLTEQFETLQSQIDSIISEDVVE